MSVSSELILFSDLNRIKSNIKDYAQKHKITKKQIICNNELIRSRIGFILFQFKNFFD